MIKLGGIEPTQHAWDSELDPSPTKPIKWKWGGGEEDTQLVTVVSTRGRPPEWRSKEKTNNKQVWLTEKRFCLIDRLTETGSLCNFGCPRTLFINQAGLCHPECWDQRGHHYSSCVLLFEVRSYYVALAGVELEDILCLLNAGIIDTVPTWNFGEGLGDYGSNSEPQACKPSILPLSYTSSPKTRNKVKWKAWDSLQMKSKAVKTLLQSNREKHWGTEQGRGDPRPNSNQ